MNKTFCEKVVVNGLRSLKSVYLKYFFNEEESKDTEENLALSDEENSDNEAIYFDDLLRDNDEEKQNKEPEKFKIEIELEKEIVKLAEILNKTEFLKTVKSNKSFWNKYMNEMPRLAKLAIVLLNINVSGAFIERFFSICGIICKKSAGNMRDDLIITRSMLKANIQILEELCNVI